jgi:hypothetical protein
MHHAAIVLWDSSNENDGDPAFYYDVVLTTIAQTDGSRPLVSTQAICSCL